MKTLEISKLAREEIKTKYSERLKSEDKDAWKKIIEEVKTEIESIETSKNSLAIEDTKILSSFRRGYVLKKILYIITSRFGDKFMKPKYL
jgi:polyribonucleotide nucleotidyltransferase